MRPRKRCGIGIVAALTMLGIAGFAGAKQMQVTRHGYGHVIGAPYYSTAQGDVSVFTFPEAGPNYVANPYVWQTYRVGDNAPAMRVIEFPRAHDPAAHFQIIQRKIAALEAELRALEATAPPAAPAENSPSADRAPDDSAPPQSGPPEAAPPKTAPPKTAPSGEFPNADGAGR